MARRTVRTNGPGGFYASREALEEGHRSAPVTGWLLVRTKGTEARRRAGRVFGPAVTRILICDLNNMELAAIEADPYLISERITTGP